MALKDVLLHLDMFKKLAFAVVCCLTFYMSQSQTFVDDVEHISYVVLDYCVDAEGQRYDIKINQDKTTYHDEGWQQGCIDHFKKIDWTPIEQANDCFIYVYEFINSEYEFYVHSPATDTEKQAKCKAFHKGTYKYQNPWFSNTKIVRRKHKQIEKNSTQEGNQIYGILWADDCYYTLEALKMPPVKGIHEIGTLINVEIMAVLNDSTYIYRSENYKRKRISYGVIVRE